MRITVEISRLGADGAGVGHVEEGSLEVHVPGAAPGEVVLAQIQHVSPHRVNDRKRAWAQLVSVVQTSAERRVPLCAAFGQCGGCAVAHVALERQRLWKREQLVETLGAVGIEDAKIGMVKASALSEGYRNQSKLVVGRDRSGKTVLGAYAPRSHDVVDTTGCALVEAPLERVANTLRQLVLASCVVPYDEETGKGELRYVILRANHLAQVLVTLVVPTEGPRMVAVAAELTAMHSDVVGVVLNVNNQAGNALMGPVERCVAGVASLPEAILNTQLTLSSRAFFQVNRGVAADLYTAVRERVKTFADHQVEPVAIVEVYAGIGVIASELLPMARSVVAIESNPAVASHYLPERGIVLVQADATAGLTGVAAADVVVLNPPRAGCAASALAQVLRLRPGLLCYISCNPKTLARDLHVLCQGGYRVELVVPFDMMPHTPHVETLVFLVSEAAWR
ncbi:MAG: 23S rRNA (uracil(1939)-C(5))-methyltransferase RlmD [Deltaproteobacteria bacterium]|nr:23S rRNA (uracil(1939)-C(5))-methyltransferase RlmD [Deltaproteobacteria bacterium]